MMTTTPICGPMASCLPIHRRKLGSREESPGRPGHLVGEISTQRFDHPFFARMWTMKPARESQALRDLRQENLAGLSGRALEVVAGTGTNFGFYPDTVREVIALEPEPRLFAKAIYAPAQQPCQ